MEYNKIKSMLKIQFKNKGIRRGKTIAESVFKEIDFSKENVKLSDLTEYIYRKSKKRDESDRKSNTYQNFTQKQLNVYINNPIVNIDVEDIFDSGVEQGIRNFIDRELKNNKEKYNEMIKLSADVNDEAKEIN